MKKLILKLFIFTSLLLVACNNNTNNNQNETENTSPNEEISQNFSSSFKSGERLSYEEYVTKYGDDYNNQLEMDLYIDENNENYGGTSELNDNNLLATFSTPLKSSSDERVNNIEIVCDRLNDFILKPNEIFSYNNVTGPFGPADGFEEAPIILSNGKKDESYGGGVCQLSSTLYNVVKNIKNLDITERHHHSAPVTYVPKGEDATVSLQSGKDFKFVNNTGYSIKFKANCDDKQVTVSAYKET